MTSTSKVTASFTTPTSEVGSLDLALAPLGP